MLIRFWDHRLPRAQTLTVMARPLEPIPFSLDIFEPSIFTVPPRTKMFAPVPIKNPGLTQGYLSRIELPADVQKENKSSKKRRKRLTSPLESPAKKTYQKPSCYRQQELRKSPQILQNAALDDL
ncbi:hypothetical protein KQX54_012685 [Cotesia glomerata]|uniref:Uncharacterized protein n=1 Tax=Cotesia glomerata TaxID=32391 RepID=A0AAV7I320_COTGL|nr:hypothetical protein KQX54_012685 [Cotesia glomerata]